MKRREKTETFTSTAAPVFKEQPWYDRFNALNVTLLAFAVAVFGSVGVMEGSGRSLNYFENFLRFMGRFFPPDFSVMGAAGSALLETFRIAVMATFFAVPVSLVMAAAAARNISPRWLVSLTRFILNMIRTVPSLVWALIAVVIVGANALAGVVALSIYSIGYLGKFFSDAFESVDNKSAQALQHLGAHPVQVFQYGVWPLSRPLIWSHSLWMLEYNIRAGSIIGYVGAGGIGTLLHTYQEFAHWDRFATVLLMILVVVVILDALGEYLRAKLNLLQESQR